MLLICNKYLHYIFVCVVMIFSYSLSSTIGKDRYYTNKDIEGRANAQTVERLEKEGATDKSLLPFRKHARKYHRRVVIDEYFHWMTSDKYHNTYDVHTPLHLSSNTHD